MSKEHTYIALAQYEGLKPFWAGTLRSTADPDALHDAMEQFLRTFLLPGARIIEIRMGVMKADKSHEMSPPVYCASVGPV